MYGLIDPELYPVKFRELCSASGADQQRLKEALLQMLNSGEKLYWNAFFPQALDKLIAAAKIDTYTETVSQRFLFLVRTYAQYLYLSSEPEKFYLAKITPSASADGAVSSTEFYYSLTSAKDYAFAHLLLNLIKLIKSVSAKSSYVSVNDCASEYESLYSQIKANTVDLKPLFISEFLLETTLRGDRLSIGVSAPFQSRSTEGVGYSIENQGTASLKELERLFCTDAEGVYRSRKIVFKEKEFTIPMDGEIGLEEFVQEASRLRTVQVFCDYKKFAEKFPDALKYPMIKDSAGNYQVVEFF